MSWRDTAAGLVQGRGWGSRESEQGWSDGGGKSCNWGAGQEMVEDQSVIERNVSKRGDERRMGEVRMAPPQYFITWFVELSGTSSDASNAAKSAPDDCHSFFGSIFTDIFRKM